MTQIIETQWNKIRNYLDKQDKEDLVDMLISEMKDETAIDLLNYIGNGE